VSGERRPNARAALTADARRAPVLRHRLGCSMHRLSKSLLHGYWRALALAVVVVCATGPGTPAPEGGPLPPCTGASYPASLDLGALPQVQVWNSGGLPASWRPPACTGWTRRNFKMLIALAGRFRHDGDAQALLGRFGAVSALREITLLVR
jgi:hypothetical protein